MGALGNGDQRRPMGLKAREGLCVLRLRFYFNLVIDCGLHCVCL